VSLKLVYEDLLPKRVPGQKLLHNDGWYTKTWMATLVVQQNKQFIYA